jgi:hypothetical protein
MVDSCRSCWLPRVSCDVADVRDRNIAMFETPGGEGENIPIRRLGTTLWQPNVGHNPAAQWVLALNMAPNKTRSSQCRMFEIWNENRTGKKRQSLSRSCFCENWTVALWHSTAERSEQTTAVTCKLRRQWQEKKHINKETKKDKEVTTETERRKEKGTIFLCSSEIISEPYSNALQLFKLLVDFVAILRTQFDTSVYSVVEFEGSHEPS